MSVSRFLFHSLSKILATKNLYLTKSLNYKLNQSLPPNYDYVRFSTLGLCYEEITNKNVKGNIAEVGVYKGVFAKRMNKLFRDRTLYLFDTFEGFDGKDVEVEKNSGYSKGDQDFSDTSVQMVMRSMPYPEKCVVKKGFFPDTASDVEDSFCFVSLDADLYEPILQGLIFFYPRLEKGGYIFIHDFNNDEYKGARPAVLKYCNENGINYVPIPDSGGTVIITK
jgi:O-methyltransferase